MRIALLPNKEKEEAIKLLASVREILIKRGHEVLTDDSIGLDDSLDVYIAIGGDGTILRVAKLAAKFDKPVLGINLGRIGYMAGLEVLELDKICPLLEGEHIVEKRMMIDAFVNDKFVGTALNDAVISSELSRLIDYRVLMNGSKFSYRADGLIVSSPTGSTAYSLSAGGPVLDPLMECLLFTPICPHTLFNRSLVFSKDTKLNVYVSEKYTGKVFLTLDGERAIELNKSDEISFSHSKKYARLIMAEKKNFYDVLSKKLI